MKQLVPVHYPGKIFAGDRARHPLKLLPQDRGICPTEVVQRHSGRSDKEQRLTTHLHSVQVPAQHFAAFEKRDCQNMHTQKQQPRNVNREDYPAMSADEPMPLRKGQGEVQEESSLKQSSRDVPPVNGRIKSVQFSRVMERVGNERDQTEDIKVSRARRGPAPQQNIQPDAKIDKSNQAKPVVLRSVGRNRNEHHIDRDRLPSQGKRSLRPGAYTIQFAGSSRCGICLSLVNRGELVAIRDTGPRSGSANFDSISGKSALMLDPPHSVVWNLELTLSLKIITGVNHGSSG